MRKLAKLPRWLYDRVRWSVFYRVQQRIKGWRSYDYDGMFGILGRLANVPPVEIAGHYAELERDGIYRDLVQRIKAVPDMAQDHADLKHLGPEKFFRLDRTALYCLVRAMKPEVFIETGTRFGVSSYFIARAMQKNGRGHLWTFDVGVEFFKNKTGPYYWPKSQTEIGFLVPDELRRFVTFVPGNSLDTLPQILPTVGPVGIYYFDSYQKYEHMTGEYRLVWPRMAPGGLFMSEDTDENSAWRDFLADKQYACAEQYCSHYGITTEREVSAVRVH